MKRITKLLILLCLVVAIATSLVACGSTYGKVEGALKNIGYKVVQTSNEAEDIKEESDVVVTPHILSNADSLGLTEAYKLNIVIVFEFRATDEMLEMYKESDTLKGFIKDVKDDGSAQEFYNSLVEKGYANGNCLIFSTNPLAESEVKTAIKQA